jgi:hypothetical protein
VLTYDLRAASCTVEDVFSERGGEGFPNEWRGTGGGRIGTSSERGVAGEGRRNGSGGFPV